MPQAGPRNQRQRLEAPCTPAGQAPQPPQSRGQAEAAQGLPWRAGVQKHRGCGPGRRSSPPWPELPALLSAPPLPQDQPDIRMRKLGQRGTPGTLLVCGYETATCPGPPPPRPLAPAQGQEAAAHATLCSALQGLSEPRQTWLPPCFLLPSSVAGPRACRAVPAEQPQPWLLQRQREPWRQVLLLQAPRVASSIPSTHLHPRWPHR